MSPKSTWQVAQEIGVTRATLEKWLKLGKVKSPKSLKVGGNAFRNWTPADIERVKKYKEAKYWTGGGRKPKA